MISSMKNSGAAIVLRKKVRTKRKYKGGNKNEWTESILFSDSVHFHSSKDRFVTAYFFPSDKAMRQINFLEKMLHNYVHPLICFKKTQFIKKEKLHRLVIFILFKN